jgi:hypothetical protein
MIDDTLRFRPKRRAELTLRTAETGFEIVDESGATVAALNDTGVALWRVCDGDATVDEIVQAAAQLFDAPVAVISADVTRAIEEFRAQGLLEDEPSEQSR